MLSMRQYVTVTICTWTFEPHHADYFSKEHNLCKQAFSLSRSNVIFPLAYGSPRAKSYRLQIAIHLSLRSTGPKNYLKCMFLRIGRQTHTLLLHLTRSRPMPLTSSPFRIETQHCYFAFELSVLGALGSYWKTVG